jgi:hypothetical protein
MTDDDKALLEAAARAAGYSICQQTKGVLVAYEPTGEPGIFDWNPLLDDGDALRLAVRLRLDVLYSPADVEVIASESGYGHEATPFAIEALGDDPYAATRRAIVRAAASMGEAK